MYRAFAPKGEPVQAAAEETVKKVSPQAEQLNLFSSFDELDAATSSKKDIKTNDHLYQYIDSPKALSVLVRNLLEKPALAFDTETTSLNELEAQLIGVSFSYKKGLAYYIPMPEDKQEAQVLLDIMRPVFEKKTR
jgi:DNA polymerase-1